MEGIMRIARVVPTAALSVLLLAFAPQIATAQEITDPVQILSRTLMFADMNVNAAKIVQDRGQNRDLRNYAEDVEDRFRTLSSDTHKLVEQAKLPQTAARYDLGPQERKLMDDLTKADGRTADRAFLDIQD